MGVIVVGCGLTGVVIARELANAGLQVDIWDRRNHIGGNMYDYRDEYGILVHKYGPHTFHTSNKKIYDYICGFSEWRPYKLTCGAVIDGKYVPTPFNFATIDSFFSKGDAECIKENIRKSFPDRKSASVLEVIETGNPIVKKYGEFLFQKDYRLYTAKQWGVDPLSISPSVFARVPLRFSYDDGYFEDIYQVMPATNYVDFFKAMLAHPNISIELGVDALKRIDPSVPLENTVVYTGTLDAFFRYKYGRLPYRSLRFEWVHENLESKQPAPVVAYPQAERFTRITEYNKLPIQYGHGTTYAIEYPLPCQDESVDEPYYPVPSESSNRLYALYLEESNRIEKFYPCGRLGDYKYYNMDQAIERALSVANKILKEVSV